jgi:hypothetical protein
VMLKPDMDFFEPGVDELVGDTLVDVTCDF